jgi:[ribosomal protein S5]-alanine N-acetyltransferase
VVIERLHHSVCGRAHEMTGKVVQRLKLYTKHGDIMENAKGREKPARIHETVGTSTRVIIRAPVAQDCDQFVDMVVRSRKLHNPWVSPPDTPTAFADYLHRHQAPHHRAFLLCHRFERSIIGVFNLSEIVRGIFLSAYLGYHVDERFSGQGYMTEGLRLVLRHAFVKMRLHRLEANIQPENVRSIRLVQRCGFSREGYSPRYLKINNRWRDHERWAILSENWRSSGSAMK